MIVCCVNAGVRSLTRAHALHPVAHVRERLVVGSSVCRGFSFHSFLFHQRHSWQQERLLTHCLCMLLFEPTFRTDLVGIEIQTAAVRVVDLLHVARAVGLTR